MKYALVSIALIIISCKFSNNKMADNNVHSVIRNYTPIIDSILFTDSSQNIYIRIWSKMQSRVNTEERYFYYDATLLNDSVLSLSKIINTNTFRKINDTLYSDTNYIYQLSDLPSKFPNIVAKELKKKNKN